MNEKEFGAQIRRARLLADIDQRALADAANISPVTLAKLEKGQGSTLTTLFKVLHALGRDDWLATLEPASAVSPLARAREAEGRREPQRVSRRTSLGTPRQVKYGREGSPLPQDSSSGY